MKKKSTSGVKFEDIDPDFAAMISKAARHNLKNSGNDLQD